MYDVATPGLAASDKFRQGATAALAAKAGLMADDRSNEFRAHTLFSLARNYLESSGISARGQHKMEVVAAALTRTDFGNLLKDVANKAMLKGYQEAPETFEAWTTTGTLSDFKPGERVDLNTFPSLLRVEEGAEYRYATIGDRGETIQLATYGNLFAITRQAIINDDLGAFTRVPRKMGRAARRTIGDLVYAVLVDNPNMRDGVPLFDSAHGNLLTASAISTDSVDAMRAAMATQKDGDANLGIRLARIVVPVALEGKAKVVAESQYHVGDTAMNTTISNSVRGTFEVISDARLDAAGGVAWFGTADPDTHDTIEVAYLDGNDQPYLEQRSAWTTDGAEFKVRIDAAVKALDYRTMAKNPGA